MIDLNNDPSNFNLPGNLRALRRRMKWSQEELAEKLGLNRGNIASYESGTAEPKICNLVKFAQLFNISIFDLTHNNLNEDNAFVQASQRQSNGTAQHAILQYAEEAKEIESAIKGLECIFKMKTRNLAEASDELQFFKNQYEQLNNVARHLLNSHFELISLVNCHCPEQQAKLKEEAERQRALA